MTLEAGRPGESYVISGMELAQALEHRLAALGMTLGTKVSVLEKKEGGAMILKVRGTRFAVGRGIARGIEVG